MVWFTMSLAPHAGNKKRKKSDSKPHSQINKCLNEKRRREQENIHIEELAELVSASPSDMSSLSCKPDKCAILKETVNQIRNQPENELCDDLQQSEVSSSKPNIINNQVFGSILLEALEGFLFVVNIDGKIEFVSENILSFLNFHQEELNDKNIYDFIHPDDRARFNSNLLLMMPLGNGRDWSSENNFNSGKTTKHFNCRFLLKQEDLEVKMESKSSQEPQYENLNITANYMSLGGDNVSDESRNGLTCIARRIAYEDKRVGLNKVEQFTTRIDQDWKVVDLDTSMLSQSSNQYLRKELLGSSIVDFCHPNDLPTMKQHLKETFENEGSTCVPYKFRIGQDRYARIKTKSRCFRKAQTNEEYVISTHSVIRDSDTSSSSMESPKPIQSPSSVASTSSGPGSVSDSSTSINGGMALSPAPLSNSFGNFSNALGAGNSTDYVLGDLVLDMFPGGNWNLDPASTQSKDSDCTSMTSFASSPPTAPMSNRSDTPIAASPTNNSAFVSALGSARSTSSASSPVMQNRAPTPYGGTCYSPSTSQSNSGRNSPPRPLSAKSVDSVNCSSTDNLAGHNNNNNNLNSINNANMNNIIQNMRQYEGMRANQKLRNLLTQNSDSAAGRQTMRQNSQEEVMVLGDSRVFDNSSQLNRVGNQSVPRTSDVILRDLLNQEEDTEAPVEPIRIPEGSVPNPLMQAGACKPLENSAQQRLGNNNMLRKLLNNDDSDRNYRKPQDLIHQLLTSHSGNKASSLQNDRLRTDSLQSPRIADVPKPLSAVPGRSASDAAYLSESAGMKRKANDKSVPIANKKSANHTQLAGQNPMLASMLAQTPRTPPLNLPTDAASTLRNQLPQERLPKNLEKKLVHTPVTAPTSMNTVSSASYTQATQRDIVTSDTRGHLMQSAMSQVNLQSGLRTVYSHQQQQQQQQQQLQQQQLQQQQQQMLLDKLVVSGTDEDLMLAKSMGHDIFGLSSSPASSSASMQNQTYSQLLAAYNNQLAAPAVDNTASLSLANILNDTNLLSDNSMVDPLQAGASSSDLNEHTILEQIYSLQEEHKVSAPQKASNPATILKNFLSDSMEFQESSIAQQPTSVNSTLDINDKIAISRIQKDLMATSPLGIGSKADNTQNVAAIPTYSQAGRSLVSRTNLVQAQLTQEQILLLQQQQQLSGSLPPNYNLVTNRVRLPVTTQNNNVNLLNQEILAQRRNAQMVRNVAVGNVNVNPNQLRKALKQKQLYLQQEQKRLLQQQQKQQLTMQTQQHLEVNNSAGTTAFPENMTELLNNTVAPNVTLLRSSGIPEVPGSARFNLPSAPLPSPTGQPSPSQLSPGQRASPFSPLPPFPSHTPPPSYPQQGPSPSPSLGREGGSPQWNQRMATSPIQQNLQLQNPMLNAQLSQQASIGANQARLTAQQRQQLALRSMPSPTSVQNSRGMNQSVYSPQSEGNFSPLSPGMVLQSQAQQQRIQRVRIASGSHQQQQQNFSSEPLLSPQPLPSPSYSQSSSTTPTSTYVAISSPSGMPVTYSLAPANQHFTFDRQNFQSYAATSNESLRSPAADQSNNDALRQELRALINSQNQLVLSSQNNQQLVQSLSSGSNARVLNIQSLTREALEELGLSVELLPDAQSGSQAMFPQNLLNDVNSLENAAQPASPRVQVEEPKPADQKKSLLQQLLSEPT